MCAAAISFIVLIACFCGNLTVIGGSEWGRGAVKSLVKEGMANDRQYP